MHGDSAPFVVAFLASAAALSLIPSYIAATRGHENAGAILTLGVVVSLVVVGCVVYNWGNPGLVVATIGWLVAVLWSLLAGSPTQRKSPAG